MQSTQPIPLANPANLPDDPARLKSLIQELREHLERGQRREEILQARLEELLRKLYGRKSEKLDPNQLDLLDQLDLEPLGIEPANDPEPEVEETPAEPRRRPKRRRPSKELPRRRVEYQLPEAERQCPCCQEPMAAIREEIHEQLDYVPASLEVVEHVTFVYGCQKGCDEKVASSSKPPQMVEKGLAGPGLLAQVMVSRFNDHLPYFRQERIFARQGVELPRATLGGWAKIVSEGVQPLVDHLKDEHLLCSFVVATDDTTVPVQKKGGTYKGRIWVHVGDDEHPVVVYDYTPTRSRAGPKAFFEKYGGFIQADGYSGYDELFLEKREPRIFEVGCWMHARRYFYEASQKDKGLPYEALAMVRELYRIERQAQKRGLSADERHLLRQEKAVPILDAFEAWIKKHRLAVLPKSPLGKAMTYASNQWQALRRYTDDGRLEIDNGRSERMLRPVALGRKNWLFAGNDAGGRRATNFYTLIGTCQYNGWDSFAYLRWLFEELPKRGESRLAELTPMAWAAAHGLKSKRIGS
jgi:transposase